MKYISATDLNGKLFVDTSAWITIFLSTEKAHSQFGQLLKQAVESKTLIYTSNDIIDETYTRLRYYVGWHMAKKFIDYIQKSILAKVVIQLWTDEQVQLDAIKTLEKYSDHNLSLTDATTSVLAKNVRITTILTTDYKHFTTLDFRVLPQPK